ncbi:MAG TPA: CsbD family protein [Steroidobacteraceae bacterium]|nr:CsbD family protein [Steroidobacteraceae bacterium]
MTNDRVAGAWRQIKGRLKEQWGRLLHDDLKQIEGHAERLVGRLQETYGLPREEAERYGEEFRRRLNYP